MIVTDVSWVVRSGSWNIRDILGFRAVLFIRAKAEHAAGAPTVQPFSDGRGDVFVTRSSLDLRESKISAPIVPWLAYSPAYASTAPLLV